LKFKQPEFLKKILKYFLINKNISYLFFIINWKKCIEVSDDNFAAIFIRKFI